MQQKEELFRTCDASYVCGTREHPHRSKVLLPSFLSDDSIIFCLRELGHELCPSCLLEERARTATMSANELGIKPLIGTGANCELAEIVRAHVTTIWMAEKALDASMLAILFNRPINRLARLWLNFRDAPWNLRRRNALFVALCANNTEEGE